MTAMTIEGWVAQQLKPFPERVFFERYSAGGSPTMLFAASELLVAIFAPLMPREHFAAVFETVMDGAAERRDDPILLTQVSILLHRAKNEGQAKPILVADGLTEAEAEARVSGAVQLVQMMTYASGPALVSAVRVKLVEEAGWRNRAAETALLILK
ncbi:hypothetical protein [Microbacterium sp. P5_E9]